MSMMTNIKEFLESLGFERAYGREYYTYCFGTDNNELLSKFNYSKDGNLYVFSITKHTQMYVKCLCVSYSEETNTLYDFDNVIGENIKNPTKEDIIESINKINSLGFTKA